MRKKCRESGFGLQDSGFRLRMPHSGRVTASGSPCARGSADPADPGAPPNRRPSQALPVRARMRGLQAGSAVRPPRGCVAVPRGALRQPGETPDTVCGQQPGDFGADPSISVRSSFDSPSAVPVLSQTTIPTILPIASPAMSPPRKFLQDISCLHRSSLQVMVEGGRIAR